MAETEARLADLAASREVIADLVPAREGPEPAEVPTIYQDIMNAFSKHPEKVFRTRELHELIAMPTDGAFVNLTRIHLGRLTLQGFLTQPGRGGHQKRT
ncbi:hypothetical protein [Streptomyces mirabilis]|uniref:hypothetical protein n=1 Tax=Streptomyces mirabilis TaxID=68239 RepID=UPI0036E537BD